MEFYERASGARFHANYLRPGHLTSSVTQELLQDIYGFCQRFNERINEIQELLTYNRI
jgi:NADH:ubiquinone oxidoreductase subunit D